jgi:hypothetical protein
VTHMASVIPLVRFFKAVPPVPSLMVGTFAVIVTVAGAALAIDATRGAAVVTPVIVLQVFAVSSGLAVPARHGHYDLLLTRGDGLLLIAAAHWTMSVVPGAVSWLAVGAAEMLAAGSTRSAALASGTCVVMFLVSTLPWAISMTLPRFAASVGWVLVLVTAAALAPAEQLSAWLRDVADGRPSVPSATTFLVYPLSVAGRHLSSDHLLIVLPAVAVAVSAVIVACAWVIRADFPLEAAQ